MPGPFKYRKMAAKMSVWGMGFAALWACIFAILMVFQRSLYSCAICLLAALLQTAALFYFAGAPLIAFLQVMIYAGAVMVLIVVTIMTARGGQGGGFQTLSAPGPLAAAAVLVPMIELAFVLVGADLPSVVPSAGAAAQAQVGGVLFGSYAVATEAVTALMFLAALALGKETR